jgi:glycosyltransferase involved in cell wall biosynthesis
MSLVGTRPILQDELQKYELHHRARIAIKPGITGMWQVSGRSDITDFEEVVRLDTEYISNWNFGLDIKILFKTVMTVLKREKFGLTENSYILFLGRLVPEKGIRYLIEAFKNVCTDKKLVIAGGSSDTDSFMKELQELAKEDDRIIFTGFVQGKILDELYSNAYIYTLPSDLEGMPLSLLEAMSYGNCCLVSDIPECTEVVEDKALIFKKSDIHKQKLQFIQNPDT